MKKKEKTTVGSENKDIQTTENTKSKAQFSMSQKLVIAMVTVVCVAVIVSASLWILMRNSARNSEKDLVQRTETCSDYVVNVINTHKAEDDIGQAMDEIRAMAYSISGRILVIDSGYRIAVDSYDKDTGKYMLDSNVLEVMSGKSVSMTEDTDGVLKKLVAVINSEGYTDAVAVIMCGTDELTVQNEKSQIWFVGLLIAAVALASVLAWFIARLSVRDVDRVKDCIEGMTGGSLEQMNTDGMFKETQELTKVINAVFNKAQLLEESRQEFVSNVSHELKTPITSMKVLSESLLTQSDVPAEMYREFMEDIVQEIDREAEIISDLLTLVKTDKGPDSLNKESVDMNEFMELILKRLKPLAEKRSIQLSFESFRDVSADIDKVKFTLAISNLIENGIKYNVDGGWIRVSLNADHRNFYIKVADSGVGIPEDCINHIFERFYRVDKARSRDTGGTGLGLAITKNIILMHKGTINVYSEPGKGTTFTVKVPLGYQQ